MQADSFGSGRVAGFCVHGSEHSASIKGRGSWPADQLLRKDSPALITWFGCRPMLLHHVFISMQKGHKLGETPQKFRCVFMDYIKLTNCCLEGQTSLEGILGYSHWFTWFVFRSKLKLDHWLHTRPGTNPACFVSVIKSSSDENITVL